MGRSCAAIAARSCGVGIAGVPDGALPEPDVTGWDVEVPGEAAELFDRRVRLRRQLPVDAGIPPVQDGDAVAGVAKRGGQIDHTVGLLDDSSPRGKVDEVLVLPHHLLVPPPLARGRARPAGTAPQCGRPGWPNGPRLGAREAALVAGLTGVGMTSGPAVAAVLAYRLATHWMPVLPGWIFFTSSSTKTSSDRASGAQ